MNEFELSEQQSELETLKKTQPRWSLAVPEPFSKSAQQDVTPPTWNKIKTTDFGVATGTGETDNGSTFSGITVFNGLAWYATIQGSLDGLVP